MDGESGMAAVEVSADESGVEPDRSKVGEGNDVSMIGEGDFDSDILFPTIILLSCELGSLGSGARDAFDSKRALSAAAFSAAAILAKLKEP
jgi:hypothetical protein